MAVIPAQVLNQPVAVVPSFVAATATGDRVPAGQGVVVHVRSNDTTTGAAARTVTLVTPGTVEGDLAIADRVYTVPAVGEVLFPVGPNYRAADGLADLTYPTVTGVTVAVYRV